MPPYRNTILLLAAVLFFAGSARLHAGDDDHELATRALREGRILPLAEIVAKVKSAHPGKLLEVELEDEDGKLVYDLKILDPRGLVRELEVDAATGKVLKVEDDD